MALSPIRARFRKKNFGMNESESSFPTHGTTTTLLCWCWPRRMWSAPFPSYRPMCRLSSDRRTRLVPSTKATRRVCHTVAVMERGLLLRIPRTRKRNVTTTTKIKKIKKRRKKIPIRKRRIRILPTTVLRSPSPRHRRCLGRRPDGDDSPKAAAATPLSFPLRNR